MTEGAIARDILAADVVCVDGGTRPSNAAVMGHLYVVFDGPPERERFLGLTTCASAARASERAFTELVSRPQGDPITPDVLVDDVLARMEATGHDHLAVFEPDGRFVGVASRAVALAHLRKTVELDSLARLAAGIAHDVNNFIAVARCGAQILGERLRDTEHLDELAQICEACDHAAALSRQLLALGRKAAPLAPPGEGVSAEVSPSEAPRRPSGVALGHLPSLRVLVADDDPAVRAAISSALTVDGHSVTLASDGREALRALARSEVDVFVTDLVMPEKEGLEIIVEARKLHPALRIVAISGSAQAPLFLGIAERLGASASLVKPVDPGALRSALRDDRVEPV